MGIRLFLVRHNFGIDYFSHSVNRAVHSQALALKIRDGDISPKEVAAQIISHVFKYTPTEIEHVPEQVITRECSGSGLAWLAPEVVDIIPAHDLIKNYGGTDIDQKMIAAYGRAFRSLPLVIREPIIPCDH